MSRVLVTGAAGFIGFHLTRALLARTGVSVVGVDNVNPYYSPVLKRARLKELAGLGGFSFHETDLSDRAAAEAVFAGSGFDRVVHLAAQAGVRHSLDHPHEYVDSNIVAFVNVLEECRRARVPHVVYASSSSVYGAGVREAGASQPFSEADRLDEPESLYAATKRAGELLAHTYGHIHGVMCTGLRFFTVYGPWGRPDMAYFSFVDAISQGRPIPVYNYGDLRRDFTYVDDVVEGIIRVVDADVGRPARHKVYNIGAGRPVSLVRFIEVIEESLGVAAKKELLPMQPGDVPATWADVGALQRDFGFGPSTTLEEGVPRFVAWYRDIWVPLLGAKSRRGAVAHLGESA